MRISRVVLSRGCVVVLEVERIYSASVQLCPGTAVVELRKLTRSDQLGFEGHCCALGARGADPTSSPALREVCHAVESPHGSFKKCKKSIQGRFEILGRKSVGMP